MQTFIQDVDVWQQAPEQVKALLAANTEEFGSGLFALGEESDPDAPGVVMLRLGPNMILARHAHDCYRFETVVSGSLLAADRLLRPGDCMVALPGQPYGPHRAGPEGVITCEVFSQFSAAYEPVFESPEGHMHKYNFLAGDIPSQEVLSWNERDAPVA